MMPAYRKLRILPLLFLMLAGLACAFTSRGSAPETSTATPAPGDFLNFTVPLYSVSLKPGDAVPGTQLYYVGRGSDAFNVTIDGLPTTKRIGDSFNWKGVIAPGVIASYSLRISPTLGSDNLLAAGPVEVTVLNPVPVELNSVAGTSDASFHFSNIPIQHHVSKGSPVPGTSLVYEGGSDQGAQLSGTSGYPYRALGDSLIWNGRLRGNVDMRYSLRVAALNDESLRLLGTAELWIRPSQ